MLLFTKADNTARKGEQRNNLADLGNCMKQPDRDVCEEILKKCSFGIYLESGLQHKFNFLSWLTPPPPN